MAISDNIHKIRLNKGLTQKQVAEACGVVDATIRMYELGKANPKPATVAKIAKALGVSVAELYGVDWMPMGGVFDQETKSAMYQSALPSSDGTVPIGIPNKTRLLIAFDHLNPDGQMEAIKRIEEMAHVPAYQAASASFTNAEKEQFHAACNSMRNAQFELFLMEQSGRENPNAINNSNKLLEEAYKTIGGFLLKYFVCNEVIGNNMPLLRALQAHAEKEAGFGASHIEMQGTAALSKAIRCIDIVLHGSGRRSRTWYFRFCPDLQTNKAFLTKDVFDGMKEMAERQGCKASIVLESQDMYKGLCNYYGGRKDKPLYGISGKISPLPQGVSIMYFEPKTQTIHERKFPE